MNLTTRIVKSCLILTIAIITYAPKSYAQDSLKSAQAAVSAGNFNQAIIELEKLPKAKLASGKAQFLLGVATTRMGEHKKASEHFSAARKAGYHNGDLYYEWGQALYADNQLVQARGAFIQSYKKKYMVTVSLYYIAYIHQVLEEYQKSIQAYKKIIQDPKSDSRLLQVAHFQHADVVLLKAEKDKEDSRDFVEQKVIPLYEKAEAVDNASSVAVDIKKKAHDIKVKYHLDPGFLITGAKIPDKKHQVFLSQTVTYDNNMTLATTLPTAQASSKDSFIFKTSISAGRSFYKQQKYTLLPAVFFNYSRHTDQDNSEVYQNDGYDGTISFKTRTEHFAFGSAAGFLFDLDYNTTNKDYTGKHDIQNFSKAFSLSFGESFQYFKFGGTTVTYKYKKTSAYIHTLDTNAHTFTAIQTHIRPNNDLMIFLALATFSRAPTAPTSDTDSLLLRMDYIIPEFLPKFILNPSMAFTLLDPKLQKPTRGIEKTYNPSIKITRKTGDHLQTSIFYNYTKNSSKNKASYDYVKVQYGFELKYIF